MSSCDEAMKYLIYLALKDKSRKKVINEIRKAFVKLKEEVIEDIKNELQSRI